MTPSCSPVDPMITRTSRARIRPFTRICDCRLSQSSWPVPREVNRDAVFIFAAPPRPSLARTLLPHRACGHAMTGPLFVSRLEVVGNIRAVARRICQSGGNERFQLHDVQQGDIIVV